MVGIGGRPNGGKAKHTNRILREERVVVYDMPGTTRDSSYIPMERDEREYVLIDTAGVRKRGKTTASVKNVSVIYTSTGAASRDFTPLVSAHSAG